MALLQSPNTSKIHDGMRSKTRPEFLQVATAEEKPIKRKKTCHRGGEDED